jgi:hypothetical protein
MLKSKGFIAFRLERWIHSSNLLPVFVKICLASGFKLIAGTIPVP